jgi:ubiquinone/menaquinone biosynthesis C-methylase UbiE
MIVNPEIRLRLARDHAEELRLDAARCGKWPCGLTEWRSFAGRMLRSRYDKENLMSATQDWTAHSGEGPARYQRLLVPAVFDPFARKLVAHSGVRPGMRVLDVACGTGAVSRVAARAAGPEGSVVAVDISAPMLAIAAGCGPEAGAARIDYLEGRAEAVPVEGHAFDVALCQQGLQFFVDRAAALVAMRRALVPAGRLAIATWTDLPSTTSFAALADALERYLGGAAGAQMRQPWSLSDRDELRELAKRAGFEQIEVSTHIGTARFPRRDFARELVLATPLATQFEAAGAEAQAAILADVTAAVSACDGRDGELRHPLTANVLTAVAPDRVARLRGSRVDFRPEAETQLLGGAR